MRDHPPLLSGISWFVFSLIASSFNDLIMKLLGQSLPPIEIVFFRFLFGALSLLPCMIGLKSSNLHIHLIRGTLLFLGISLWCYGIQIVPMSVATILGFTIPLFTLPLAYFFLKERVSGLRWIATIGGFIGITVILIPSVSKFSWVALTLLASSFLFALLDILNKKIVFKESLVSMLFFSALITTTLSAGPTYFVWQPPSLRNLLLLLVLGLGANLVIYCMLRAFRSMEASALAPYRYFEPLLSSLLGFIFFQETPDNSTLIGAAIIFPMTLLVTVYETRWKTKRVAN